jgi:hypothetical protein
MQRQMIALVNVMMENELRMQGIVSWLLSLYSGRMTFDICRRDL